MFKFGGHSHRMIVMVFDLRSFVIRRVNSLSDLFVTKIVRKIHTDGRLLDIDLQRIV